MDDISPSIAPTRDEIVRLSDEAAFAIGDLAVRPALREIVKAGSRATIEPRMMQVLVALWQERDDVVSRERLIARGWGGRIVTDDAINNCIAKLRRMGEAHAAFDIETIPRVGYRLVERSARTTATTRPSQRLPLVAAAFVAVALAIVAGWVAMRPAPPPDVGVAVAALRSEPASPAGAALAGRVRDGVTAALATQRIDFVSTAATVSPMLRVGGVVETGGTAAEVRMTVADARSGAILWQGAFQGGSDLASPLPDQVTARVATAITMAADMLAASRGRISPAALRAYVQTRDGNRERRDPIEQVAYMRKVVKDAPRVALAHATLAQILVQAAAEQPKAVGEAWAREAIAESRLAIRLDPAGGETYTALSAALGAKDFAGRQAALEEGLRRAPLDGEVQSYLGLFLAETGRPMEGLPFIRRSQTIDPFAPPRRFSNVDYLAEAGAVDEARAMLASSRRTWPDNRRIPGSGSLFAVLAAAPEEGRAIIHELGRSFPDAVARPDLWLAFFDSLDCHCRTEETTAAIRQAALSGQVEPGVSVVALARLGSVDQALEVAEHGRNTGHHRDHSLLFAKQTAVMRRDPRFMDLAGRLGLVDYWRASARWPEFCAEPGLPYDCKAEAARVARAPRST